MKFTVDNGARVAIASIARVAALEFAETLRTFTVAKEHLIREPAIGEELSADGSSARVERASWSRDKMFMTIEARAI